LLNRRKQKEMWPHTETRLGSTRWLSMNEEIMPRATPVRSSLAARSALQITPNQKAA
jgi:hypothetical protein